MDKKRLKPIVLTISIVIGLIFLIIMLSSIGTGTSTVEICKRKLLEYDVELKQYENKLKNFEIALKEYENNATEYDKIYEKYEIEYRKYVELFNEKKEMKEKYLKAISNDNTDNYTGIKDDIVAIITGVLCLRSGFSYN